MHLNAFPAIIVLHFFLILSSLVNSELAADSLRIATYNLRNYNLSNRMVDGIYRKNYPKPEKEKSALRKIIKAINPDILAIQEIGAEPFLKELINDLKSEGLEYPHFSLMEAVDSDRHTAFISKLPFLEIVNHHPLEFKYFESKEIVKRGLLEVKVKWGSKLITLYNIHLKSRWTVRKDDPESAVRRHAEAKAIRNIIRKNHPAESRDLFIVVGDFNDVIISKTLKRFFKIGKTELLKPIIAVDSTGENWTYLFGKQDSYYRSDYILISPSVDRLSTELTGNIADIKEWKTASDHRLVYVDLIFED